MHRYRITVNGLSYEVEVEEIGGADPAAHAAPAAAPRRPVGTPETPPATTAPAAAAEAPSSPESDGPGRGRHAKPAPAPARAPAPASAGGTMVSAPLPGAVLEVKVAAGDSVREGQVVAVLEAMKMENEILAPCDGKVQAVHVHAGSAVSLGDPLLEIV